MLFRSVFRSPRSSAPAALWGWVSLLCGGRVGCCVLLGIGVKESATEKSRATLLLWRETGGWVLIVWVRPDELPDRWMDRLVWWLRSSLGAAQQHSKDTRSRNAPGSVDVRALAGERVRHRYPTVLPATYHLDIVSVPPCHLTKDQTRLILAAGPLPLALLKNRETLSSSSSARSLLSLTPSRSRSLHHAAHSPYL